ncbi:succinyl-CoA synthetase subunit alpha [candidate division MSBL1 archaeon SCGC-AAA259E22]|uniref:Succinate--CoA ligase [ADP-forming] subunit alpha n=2 Tax=candidate division MSBL1 TaxID=215777 RepID=A0A133U7W0_9EURY|nr:succinyl-CoA synthetase subunit alpha [candidate division MSBL1 archaeon SCGC-AAA259B11]KXA93414.1 succinyl-CoA synthetase subunit alpha [candidate division MSBL1 archaeon SCGC-AAA259E22]
MSIFVDENTKLMVQGITGSQGRFHTELMLEYGTEIVAGVTPYKGGQEVEGVPVYDTVEEAVAAGANASIVFVPARFAADSLYEAVDAGIETIVCITEGLPLHDMMKVRKYVDENNVLLIGPNTPGAITPGKAKVGIMPGDVFEAGNVGVVSRSGTLTYQIVDELTKNGIGQSTCCGIGGDPIIGTRFIDVLQLFESDDDTDTVVMIGEIGGRDEEEAAAWIDENMDTPVVSFIAGRTAPPGKRMGHAGAIVSRGVGTAESKIRALEEVDVSVGKTPSEVVEIVSEVI